MKFFAVLVAAAVATASAQTNSTSDACAIAKLAPLLSIATECGTASGLKFPPTAKPTDAVLKAACSNDKCTELATKVSALELGDCTFGAIKLESDLLTPLAAICGEPASAAGSKAAASGAGSAAEVSAAPVGASEAPAAEGSVAGSAAEGSVAAAGSGSDAAAPTVSSTPAPSATQSGASSAAVAAGAAVVAVAAAMW